MGHSLPIHSAMVPANVGDYPNSDLFKMQFCNTFHPKAGCFGHANSAYGAAHRPIFASGQNGNATVNGARERFTLQLFYL
jgi:hypothetical protein